MFPRRSGHGLDWGQPFAPDTAAVGQGGASALARIPAQEPVLPFAAYLRRLILSFHKSVQFVTRESVFPMTRRQDTFG